MFSTTIGDGSIPPLGTAPFSAIAFIASASLAVPIG
jgi:hypothetical protein